MQQTHFKPPATSFDLPGEFNERSGKKPVNVDAIGRRGGAEVLLLLLLLHVADAEM
jgi:hypothetical protein